MFLCRLNILKLSLFDKCTAFYTIFICKFFYLVKFYLRALIESRWGVAVAIPQHR